MSSPNCCERTRGFGGKSPNRPRSRSSDDGGGGVFFLRQLEVFDFKLFLGTDQVENAPSRGRRVEQLLEKCCDMSWASAQGLER